MKKQASVGSKIPTFPTPNRIDGKGSVPATGSPKVKMPNRKNSNKSKGSKKGY